MKSFILTVLSLYIFFGFNAESSENIKVYSCDECSLQSMDVLARSKAKPLQCYFNNDPGSIPGVNEQECFTTSVTLIVANPISKNAKKYQVKSIPNGHLEKIIRVEIIALSSAEHTLLSRFYDVDQEFRENISNTTLSGSYSLNQSPKESYDFERFMSNLGLQSQVDSNCQNHPAASLKSARAQDVLYKKMSRELLSNMNGQSWKEYTTSTNLTGGGIQFGAGALGLSISMEHNTQKIYIRNKWDDYNKFIFEVSYRGIHNENGEKELELVFFIDKDASLIDGRSLTSWFLPRNDFRNEPISECMVQYIESITESSTPLGAIGGSNPGSGSGNAGGCIEAALVTTHGCTPWSCNKQTFYVVRAC
ncbi:hypothetical protein ORJ66_04560 [Pseudoalteromonas tunicata]|uniref:hypothetical protein n=1 Tax=Pseudoalteromonas tunicata TaxID=314281 RepID=UPI00273E94FE|nr:hypothetical protein [Pseudoalteromonas tunicata]MDP5212312.1 hypothetical protein [Pseudoalteromonas tunicata]